MSKDKITPPAADVGVAEAVAIGSVSSGGKALQLKIERAMSHAVLLCNARGISTEEKNSSLIRACMMAARQAVKDASGMVYAEGEVVPTFEDTVLAAVAAELKAAGRVE